MIYILFFCINSRVLKGTTENKTTYVTTCFKSASSSNKADALSM